MCQFVQIFKRVMALDSILFPLNISRMNEWNLTKFGICIHIDEISVWIVMLKIVQIYNRVMALDLSQNFISTQFFKNEWMELSKILHIQDRG